MNRYPNFSKREGFTERKMKKFFNVGGQQENWM